MTVAVIVTAAGSGTRLGHVLPKALVPLAGRPVLEWAVEGVAASGVCDVLVVTAPATMLSEVSALVPADAICVAGGATRQESVANALAALPEGVEFVLVHDAARALTPPEVFERVVAALREGRAAVVPALRVTDTIKQVSDASFREGASDFREGAP
ncbi:MAG: 2-C-methyl-D-erythritol 4-phosphate cytidylyltransferase, partial [bacterium]|nr:2-C-methyl-D-erythritol 4-phosphate cytidylyltransferase [bacterium]